jgi:hypothetical protein
MKKLTLLTLLTATLSCRQEIKPSVDNINSVFETQDFGIRFTMESGDEYRMGFLNNDISYFSNQATIRSELSYDDVRLINTFVGDRFRESEIPTNTAGRIEFYNDSKK